MIDREKTALGIREMLMRDTWRDIDDNRSRYQHILNDAFAMLKEQEPIEPILDSFLHKRCPSCKTLLKGRFCHECGQAVKWE